jgi:hypothetical protein
MSDGSRGEMGEHESHESSHDNRAGLSAEASAGLLVSPDRATATVTVTVTATAIANANANGDVDLCSQDMPTVSTQEALTAEEYIHMSSIDTCTDTSTAPYMTTPPQHLYARVNTAVFVHQLLRKERGGQRLLQPEPQQEPEPEPKPKPKPGSGSRSGSESGSRSGSRSRPGLQLELLQLRYVGLLWLV